MYLLITLGGLFVVGSLLALVTLEPSQRAARGRRPSSGRDYVAERVCRRAEQFYEAIGGDSVVGDTLDVYGMIAEAEQIKQLADASEDPAVKNAADELRRSFGLGADENMFSAFGTMTAACVKHRRSP